MAEGGGADAANVSIVKVLRQKCGDLEDRLDAEEAESAKAREEAEGLRAENETLKAELAKGTGETNGAVSAPSTQVNGELDEALQKVEALEAERDAEKRRADVLSEELAASRASAGEDADGAAAAHAAQLAAAEEQREGERKRASELEESLRSLQQRLDEALAERDEAKPEPAQADVSLLQADVAELQRQLDAAVAERDALQLKVAASDEAPTGDELAALRDRVAGLEAELVSERAAREEEKAAREDKAPTEDDLAALREAGDELAALRERVAELEGELEAERAAREDNKASSAAAAEILEKQLADLCAERDSHASALGTHRARADTLASDLEAVRVRVDVAEAEAAEGKRLVIEASEQRQLLRDEIEARDAALVEEAEHAIARADDVDALQRDAKELEGERARCEEVEANHAALEAASAELRAQHAALEEASAELRQRVEDLGSKLEAEEQARAAEGAALKELQDQHAAEGAALKDLQDRHDAHLQSLGSEKLRASELDASLEAERQNHRAAADHRDRVAEELSEKADELERVDKAHGAERQRANELQSHISALQPAHEDLFARYSAAVAEIDGLREEHGSALREGERLQVALDEASKKHAELEIAAAEPTQLSVSDVLVSVAFEGVATPLELRPWDTNHEEVVAAWLVVTQRSASLKQSLVRYLRHLEDSAEVYPVRAEASLLDVHEEFGL